MKDKEKVSIIIVAHNNATTIIRALKSVAGGIRPSDQVIIADNDSKDGTYEVLCKLLGAKEVTIDGQTGLPPDFDGEFLGTPVKIFRKRLSTTGHSANMAMQIQWKGVTIFGFLDANSWFAGDKIAQAVGVFQSQPHVACVISDWDNHHENGVVERVFRNSFDCNRMLANFEYDRNFLVRAGIFGKLKSGFNEQMEVRDDYDLLLRISEIGLVYHIPAPLHNNMVIEADKGKEKSIVSAESFVRKCFTERRAKANG